MSMRIGKIHVGDNRTDFILTFWKTTKDPDNPDQYINTILTINGMQECIFTWTKPDGTTITRDMEQGVALVSDGLDGQAHFLNDKAIPDTFFPIDQGDDEWTLSGYVKLLDGSEYTSDNFYFLVRASQQ